MASPLETLRACVGFQWDEGNRDKNEHPHGVSWVECEQVFFSEPLIAAADQQHSQAEPRYYVLGSTREGRLLFIACTVREQSIRIISARPMSRRERRIYAPAEEESSQ
jgi:uncharacterized protein